MTVFVHHCKLFMFNFAYHLGKISLKQGHQDAGVPFTKKEGITFVLQFFVIHRHSQLDIGTIKDPIF